FMSYWITDRAIDYLDMRKDSDGPWFLFTSYKIPHSPYRTPEPYHSMYPEDSFDVPPIPKGNDKTRARSNSKRHVIDSEPLLRALTAQYFGHVTNVDDNIGRLLNALKDSGMDDNTIIVFTADHGNMLGDRGRFFKGVMYEGSTHVPLLMRVPKGSKHADDFNKGHVEESLIENIDIMPTLLEMAGVPVPENGIQGQSFVNLVSGDDTHWKNVCFAERSTRMVRTPEYKLIEAPGAKTGRYELYDMINDLNEEHDLANDAEYNDVMDDLIARMKAWREDVPPPPAIPGLPTPECTIISPEVRREHEAAKKAKKQKKLKSKKVKKQR
ncbi:sulfatase, partial [Candidatus Hydrogenedentota bacterium]